MKVPSKVSVEKSIGNAKNVENGKENDKEKQSIFEKNEKDVVNNAKLAIKELEMLVEKRIEMKKIKKGKGCIKKKEGDCSVSTEVKEEKVEEESDDDRNNNNNNNKCQKLGYSINRQCLVMDGRRLNIPRMRQSNPFEKLIKRQRVASNNGEIIRRGSGNYDIDDLNGHQHDSSDESEEEDDIDALMGNGDDSNQL